MLAEVFIPGNTDPEITMQRGGPISDTGMAGRAFNGTDELVEMEFHIICANAS
ncbi:hypothetical protein [Streptomyces sp. PKU-EA00015]|uniref:hypothetical protein n=1 Tax=Streptomyces sp. PKU-EA00015 TaxID=2748326 RepID=UPI0015A43261|nr:hypothetical protein [Streptomyces sp. PKU-EA00015]